MTTAQVFQVAGMNCEHCVRAVTAEVTGLPGVRAVAVDLAGGLVTVDADRPLSDGQMAAAVKKAGYELVSARPGSTP